MGREYEGRVRGTATATARGQDSRVEMCRKGVSDSGAVGELRAHKVELSSSQGSMHDEPALRVRWLGWVRRGSETVGRRHWQPLDVYAGELYHAFSCSPIAMRLIRRDPRRALVGVCDSIGMLVTLFSSSIVTHRACLHVLPSCLHRQLHYCLKHSIQHVARAVWQIPPPTRLDHPQAEPCLLNNKASRKIRRLILVGVENGTLPSRH